MLPLSSKNYSADMGIANVKPFRYGYVGFTVMAKPPYFHDLIRCKFAGIVEFPNMNGESSFTSAIRDVFFLSSNKKVSRVHAISGVAMMAYKFFIWNFPNFQYFCHSVRSYSFSASQIELSISTFGYFSHPQPTPSKFRTMFWNRSVFINFRPKSLNNALFHKQKTTPLANSVVGEVIAAICKQGDKMFSLLNSHNKADLSFVGNGGFAR